jgi:hypothetical protein
MREGSDAQNIIAVANFLQSEDVRAARTHVFNNLYWRNFTEWEGAEELIASKVCSSYGVAGVILQKIPMSRSPFLEHWGTSIVRSYKIPDKYIEHMRKPENAGATYWSSYTWLYDQVREQYPNLGNERLAVTDNESPEIHK